MKKENKSVGAKLGVCTFFDVSKLWSIETNESLGVGMKEKHRFTKKLLHSSKKDFGGKAWWTTPQQNFI